MANLDEDALETEFKERSSHPSGLAAKELLSRGHAIAYREKDTPAGHVLRRQPDGEVALVKIDLSPPERSAAAR